MQAWVHFVRKDLQQKTQVPAFMEGLLDLRPDQNLHPELHVCDYYEQVGTFFNYGLLDQQSFMDVGSVMIAWLYRYVQPCIEKIANKSR